MAGSCSAAGATKTDGCWVQYAENSVSDKVPRMKGGAVMEERSPLKEAIAYDGSATAKPSSLRPSPLGKTTKSLCSAAIRQRLHPSTKPRASYLEMETWSIARVDLEGSKRMQKEQIGEDLGSENCVSYQPWENDLIKPLNKVQVNAVQARRGEMLDLLLGRVLPAAPSRGAITCVISFLIAPQRSLALLILLPSAYPVVLFYSTKRR